MGDAPLGHRLWKGQGDVSPPPACLPPSLLPFPAASRPARRSFRVQEGSFSGPCPSALTLPGCVENRAGAGQHIKAGMGRGHSRARMMPARGCCMPWVAVWDRDGGGRASFAAQVVRPWHPTPPEEEAGQEGPSTFLSLSQTPEDISSIERLPLVADPITASRRPCKQPFFAVRALGKV